MLFRSDCSIMACNCFFSSTSFCSKASCCCRSRLVNSTSFLRYSSSFCWVYSCIFTRSSFLYSSAITSSIGNPKPQLGHLTSVAIFIIIGFKGSDWGGIVVLLYCCIVVLWDCWIVVLLEGVVMVVMVGKVAKVK